MKKVTKWAVLLWLGVMATAGMQAQSAPPQANNAAAPAAPAPAPAPGPAANTPPDYVIGSDDQLHITVWKEQELTETLPVRPDGKISMPLLNDVPAAGLTHAGLFIVAGRATAPQHARLGERANETAGHAPDPDPNGPRSSGSAITGSL